MVNNKRIRLILFQVACASIGSMLLSSCFKDEPLNAECDITKASVHVADVNSVFFTPTDTVVSVAYSDSIILFKVRRQADITAMAPMFEVTEGATLSPANGSVHDFSKGPVVYTVRSQDGQYSRMYSVRFSPTTQMVTDTVCFDFEHYALESGSQKYYIWYDVDAEGNKLYDWATGNAGYQLSMGSATPDQYPSAPSTDGYDHACVSLTTRSTGVFGEWVNKRIAAGNLFLGKFDLTQALKNPLLATQFGGKFTKRPVRMTGYYQYKAGDTFQDVLGKPVANRTDSAAIYAVFYRNHDANGNAVTLDGRNVKTSNLVVAIADMKVIPQTQGWTAFDLTFDYTADVDLDLLENEGYSLAIVFSSSKDGDQFEGAVGSNLKIDQVRIICTEEDQ